MSSRHCPVWTIPGGKKLAKPSVLVSSFGGNSPPILVPREFIQNNVPSWLSRLQESRRLRHRKRWNKCRFEGCVGSTLRWALQFERRPASSWVTQGFCISGSGRRPTKGRTRQALPWVGSEWSRTLWLTGRCSKTGNQTRTPHDTQLTIRGQGWFEARVTGRTYRWYSTYLLPVGCRCCAAVVTCDVFWPALFEALLARRAFWALTYGDGYCSSYCDSQAALHSDST